MVCVALRTGMQIHRFGMSPYSIRVNDIVEIERRFKYKYIYSSLYYMQFQ